MITFRPPFAPSLIFSFGLLIGGIAVFVLFKLTLSTQIDRQEQVYGQALANNAARDSVDAMFRNDLLQLQTLLQTVVKNPDVVSASIHSVENKILVQAGTTTQHTTKNTQTFEATIKLPDSVAGFVSVQTGSYTNVVLERVFLLFALLNLAWIGWKITSDKNIVIEKTPEAPVKPEPEPVDEPLIAPIEIEPEEDPLLANAFLAVSVKNAELLKQQLSGSAYRSAWSTLDNTLRKISGVYGAFDCQTEGGRYVFHFFSESQDDAIFHALCAGRVMLDMAGIINRVPFDLSAQASGSEIDSREIDMPFVGLALSVDEEQPEQLQDKVELIELSSEDSGRLLVSGFKEHYELLLKKQMKQLKQQGL